jgi:hypothetical protein
MRFLKVTSYTQCPESQPQYFRICTLGLPCTQVPVERETIEGKCGNYATHRNTFWCILPQNRTDIAKGPATIVGIFDWRLATGCPPSLTCQHDSWWRGPRLHHAKCDPSPPHMTYIKSFCGKNIFRSIDISRNPLWTSCVNDTQKREYPNLIQSEEHVLRAKLASAKTLYRVYLHYNRLVVVELNVDISQSQANSYAFHKILTGFWQRSMLVPSLSLHDRADKTTGDRLLVHTGKLRSSQRCCSHRCCQNSFFG